MVMPSHWLRRLRRVALAFLLLVVALVGLLQLPPVATWVARRALSFVPLSPGYRLEVGWVSGNWFTHLRLEDVRLYRDRRELASIASLGLRYNPRRLFGGQIRLRQIAATGVRATARREAGDWDLANVLRRSPDTTTGGGGFAVARLDLDDVGIVAMLAPDSAVRVRELRLRARDLVLGDRVLVTVDTVHGAISPPSDPPLWLTLAARGSATREALRLDPLRLRTDRSDIGGRVVLPRSLDDPRTAGQLDVELAALPLALADLAAMFPAVSPEGTIRLEARADAQGRLATATLGARLDDATLQLTGTTMLGHDAPAVVRLHGEVARLDPSRVLRAAPRAELTGAVDADLRGASLARSDGYARLRLDDSRLGTSRLSALELRAQVRDGRADLALRGDLAGTDLSTSGWARPFDSIPSYRLSGRALNPPGTETLARVLAGREDDPVLELGFRLEGEGTTPGSARASGRAEIAALRRRGERVELGHASMTLADRRLEIRPTLLVAGGRVSAIAVATLGDTLGYLVRDGQLTGVDLGRLLGDTAGGPVSGRFALRGSGAAPPAARAVATVHLDRLQYGERRLEQVRGTVRLESGRAELDLRAGLEGGTLLIEGSGRPFDSVPSFSVGRADIDRVDLGTLLGRPDLAGRVSVRATGQGRWGPRVRSVRGRLEVEPSTLGRIRVSEGTVVARLEGERLSYHASLGTSAGALALAGELRPNAPVPALQVREGRADSVDLGPWLGRSGLRTAISARFSGAASGTDPESMHARLALDLLPSCVNQASLDSGTARLVLDRGALGGTVEVRGEDAELAARLTGQLGEQSVLRTDGSLRIERLARWTGHRDAEGRLEGRFDLETRADSAGLLALGGSVTAGGGVGGVRLETLHLALTPQPGTLVVDTLLLRSNVAALDGGGRLALRGSGAADTLRVRGRSDELAPAASLAGLDSLTMDSTRLALEVAGPAGSWRIRGRAEAWRLLYRSYLAEHLVARGIAGGDSTPPGTLAGDIRLQGGAAGRITLKQAAVAVRYDSMVVLEGNAGLGDGDVRVGLGLAGTRRADTVRVRLGRLELDEGGRAWRLAHPASVVSRPGAMEVEGLELAATDRKLVLDGVLDRRGTSDLTLQVSNLDLDALHAVRLVPMAGRLDGRVHLSGPAANPEADGLLALTVREPDEADIGRIQSRLRWTRRGLRVDAVATQREGGRLTVEGSLPWRLTLQPPDTTSTTGVAGSAAADTMALTVRSDSLDLAFFDPLVPEEVARGLRGRMAIDARVGGAPDDPRAQGTVGLTLFGVELPALDLKYDRGALAGRFERDRFAVDSLVLFTGKDETLRANGAVVLQPLGDPRLDLTARLHDFQISNAPPLRATASGELSLAGSVSRPVLTGRLGLGPSEIVVGAGTGAAVEKVELTPEDLREVARTFGPAVLARSRSGPGLVDRFKLDLQVSFPRRVWFRRQDSPEMNIELAGRIDVRQEPGQEMQFFGQVEPIPGRGGLDLYGRRFDLTEGEIQLQGPATATQLDVTARYRVPTLSGGDDAGVLIDVHAQGRPDSLDLEFSADPTMSQEDIVSYIVTGRPASDNPLVAQGEGVQGGELALNALSGAVAGRAGEELGFDVFQIRQSGAQGLTLTAGRYLGSKLFVSLQQPLQIGSSAEAGATQSSGPGFELEYSLERWLRTTLRGGSLPSGLLFRGRYAY